MESQERRSQSVRPGSSWAESLLQLHKQQDEDHPRQQSAPLRVKGRRGRVAEQVGSEISHRAGTKKLAKEPLLPQREGVSGYVPKRAKYLARHNSAPIIVRRQSHQGVDRIALGSQLGR